MPAASASDQRLGHHRVAATYDKLVDHLGCEPAPGRTHVRETRGKVGHQRCDARDVGRFAAGHDGQRAAAGCGRPARHRCVDPAGIRSGGMEPCGKRLATGDLDGGEINDELRRSQRSRDAFVPEHRLLHGVGGRQVEQDEIDITRRLFRRARRVRAGSARRIDPRRHDVVGDDLIAER